MTVVNQENESRGRTAAVRGHSAAAAPNHDILLETVEVIGPAIDSEKKRAEVGDRVVQVVAAEFFGGPLPHPALLRAYEDIRPGLAERVVGLAERALTRRDNRLDEEMRHEYEGRRLRLRYALYGFLALLVAGIIALALGKAAIGNGLLVAAIIGTVIGTFVHGRRPHGSEPTPASPASGSEAEAETEENPTFLNRLMSLLRAPWASSG